MATGLESEQKIKFIRLDLPEDIHRLVRLLAADEGMSISAYAKESFSDMILEQAKKQGYTS